MLIMGIVDTNVLFASLGGVFTFLGVFLTFIQQVRFGRKLNGEHQDKLNTIRVLTNGRMEALIRHNIALTELLARHGISVPPMPQEDSP